MVTGLEGTFKDYKNNWSCGSLEEWKEHLAETETTHTGKTECVTCGTNVNFKWTGKLKNGKKGRKKRKGKARMNIIRSR